MEYNLKEDEYYCSHCKEFVVLKAINPTCIVCNRTLYVALRSLMDGSRITGNDELAERNSRPAPGTRKS